MASNRHLKNQESEVGFPLPPCVLRVGRYIMSFSSHLLFLPQKPFLTFAILFRLLLLLWPISVVHPNLHQHNHLISCS